MKYRKLFGEVAETDIETMITYLKARDPYGEERLIPWRGGPALGYYAELDAYMERSQ
ncbi:hypothetical protein ACIBH1_45500 [Nonomuraea sp. NPDC050663]|uniref:hypothetical protein n=1 Tax=Nonomuraea sp. NPDC050663 TaxID=3364370 RepID=UPI0037AFBED0